MRKSTQKRVFGTVALVVILLLVGYIAVYANGYRVTPNLKLIKASAITVSGVPDGTHVYNDEYQIDTINYAEGEDSYTLKNLSPGTYNLILSKPGYWPWQKKVNLDKEDERALEAFLISEHPPASVVTESDDEYTSLRDAFKELRAGNGSPETRSPSGDIKLAAEGSRVLATWQGSTTPPESFCRAEDCPETITVLDLIEEVRNIAFFNGRDGAILVASGPMVFAVDLTPTRERIENQNFQPIYSGSAPTFLVRSGEIYIEDAGKIYHVRPEARAPERSRSIKTSTEGVKSGGVEFKKEE